MLTFIGGFFVLESCSSSESSDEQKKNNSAMIGGGSSTVGHWHQNDENPGISGVDGGIDEVNNYCIFIFFLAKVLENVSLNTTIVFS